MRELLRSHVLFAGVLACGLAGLAGCSTSSVMTPGEGGSSSGMANLAPGAGDATLRVVADLPPPPAAANGVAQPVSISDIIEVSVFQVPDLSRTVQVDDAGNINLPLIGQVPAAGKSVQALQLDIQAAYGRNYLQSPSVSVLVKESAARRVTVDGEVKRAGVFPLPTSSSLLDAIALAGGFSPVADPAKVYVFRQVGDIKYVANYNVDDIRRGARPSPSVYGGDVVVVFASSSRVALQNLKEVLGVASTGARLATVP